MPVIGVINQKGGSGKSTISVHLARWLQIQGGEVLLVDSDGQGTSSQWINSLAEKIAVETIQDPDQLLDTLPKLSEQHQWIVVDGPATLSESTRATVLWCDLAVIPVQPTGVDLASASDTVRLVRQAQKIRRGEPKAVMFINRAVKGTRLKSEAISVLSEIPDVEVLESIVHQRQIIADAFGQDATVFDLTGTSAGIARREYEELFTEIIGVLADGA